MPYGWIHQTPVHQRTDPETAKDNPHIKDCLFRAITDGNIPGWSKAADSADA